MIPILNFTECLKARKVKGNGWKGEKAKKRKEKKRTIWTKHKGMEYTEYSKHISRTRELTTRRMSRKWGWESSWKQALNVIVRSLVIQNYWKVLRQGITWSYMRCDFKLFLWKLHCRGLLKRGEGWLLLEGGDQLIDHNSNLNKIR